MTETLPDVTVIVPTFQQESTLEKCIDSVLFQKYGGKIRLIVVDNSDQFLLDQLTGKYPDVTFLWEPKPGSYNARNKALEITDTPIIAFTDSDCIVKEDWVATSVDYLETHPEAGFIAGNISVFPLNEASPTIAELYEILFAFPQRTFLEQDGFGATANMVTRLDTIKAAGPFDGRLKSRGDMEWGQRATRTGKAGHYVDSAIVYHPARLHEEIIAKMKRVVAGARDREPGWKNCLVYVYRFLRPPRRKIMSVFRSQDKRFTPFTKWMTAIYCLYLTWCEAYYRIKFEIKKSVSPR